MDRRGYLFAENFLSKARKVGIRVLTLNSGLVGGNKPFGIRRTPASDEMRSNISIGGMATVFELTNREATVQKKIAKLLHKDDFHFAGLDLIGEKIVEDNVFSRSAIGSHQAIGKVD